MRGQNVDNPVESDLPEYVAAPPDYDTLINIPDREAVSHPPKYEEPTLEGYPDEPAPAYEAPSANHQQPNTLPPLPRLAYADFLPNKRPYSTNCEGNYDDFKTLMWIVNDWLSKNPHFRVIRTECIKRKIGQNGERETETTIQHCSAFGHMAYVLGVRLWLVPNSSNLPVQQIWYVNVVPKGEIVAIPQVNMMMRMNPTMVMMPPVYRRQMMFPQFENLDDVLSKVNENFRTNPLPGEVLNVETVEVKHENMWRPGCIDPDKCYWNEKGSEHALFLHILKIFFVVGQPQPNEIGVMDFAPASLTTSSSAMGKPRFEDFSNVVNNASQWMAHQQNLSVTNIQSIEMKIQKAYDSPNGYKLDTRNLDYSKGYTCVFVRILRVVYVTSRASKPPNLSVKTFVPVRTASRQAEPMSITLARANQWLNCVGNKVVGADTLKFQISAEVMREVPTEQSSYATLGMTGIYWMTVIRLYLDGPIQEPPLEVYNPPPAIFKTAQESECCSIQ